MSEKTPGPKIPGIYLVMRERTYMYKTMSELYKGKPSEPLLNAVNTERFRGLGETVDEGFGFIKGGHRLICDFLNESENPKEILSQLHKEYEKILQGAKFALQRNYETHENEDILNSLAKFYEKDNWVQSEGYPREPDHISVQCEFMFHLCAEIRKAIIITRKADVVSENLKVQRDFLYKHVYNWFPRFCDELSKRAESKFYRGVADLTKGFINIDKEVFALVMEEVSKQL